MTNVDDLVLVNALMRQALVAIEEVMGQKGLNAVLRTSQLEQYIDHLPPDDLNPAVNASDYARLNAAIEDFYGRGGRGILQRIGKASFEYAIREQSALFGLAGVALKVLSTKARVRFVLTRMAATVKKANPQLQVDVEETRGRLCLCGPHLFIVLRAAQREAGMSSVRRFDHRGRTLGDRANVSGAGNALHRQR